MKTRLVVLLCLLAAFAIAAEKRYEANWPSIDSRPTPAWFTDAKFGIFIHWGAYSVPSYGKVGTYAEWYWHQLTKGPTDKGKPNPTWLFHTRNYGENFPYANFVPMFRAELFDPAYWAEVFQKSGARYVVLTSKHHEGFTLWPSQEADRSWGKPWNSVAVGPKRDLLGDLSTAVRARGLKMGIYYSLYEWYNPLWLSDKPRYVTEHMHPQFKDVVTRYKPSTIFSDGEWDLTSAEWRSPELLAWLFNESPVKDEVAIDDRWGKDSRHKHGGYYTTEYTAGLEGSTHPWEESRGMGHSYGYNRAEQLNDYRSDREMILMLIDLVSRGGNLLLDIGPTGDGRIPVIMQQRLIQMGRWLSVNGESIYGTRAWKRTRQWSEGERKKLETGGYMKRYEVTDYVDRAKPDQAVIECFFTARGDDLYAIVPRWPGRRLIVKDVAAPKAMKVSMLGRPGALKWTAKGRNVIVEMPHPTGDPSTTEWAYVVKFEGLAR